MYADPAEHHDTAHEGEGDEDVEGADFVGDVGRDEAEEEAHADDYEEEVYAGAVGGVEDVARVAAYVEEGEVEAPEVEEVGGAVETVGWVFEGRPVDDRSCFAGWEACSVETDCDDVEGHHDEADDANRPWETILRQTLLHNHGEQHTTCTTTQCRQTQRKSPLLRKIRAHKCHTGAELESIGNTQTQRLREEQVPQFGRLGHGEDSDSLKHRSRDVHGAKQPSVGGATSPCSHGEEEEDLYTANP